MKRYRLKWWKHIFFILKHIVQMKKFTLAIVALVFAGNYADTCAAAESYLPGSSASFDEDQNHTGTTLKFTDANGLQQTITTGEGLKAQGNGYVAVTKEEIAQWGGGTEDAEPAETPAAEATTETSAELAADADAGPAANTDTEAAQ